MAALQTTEEAGARLELPLVLAGVTDAQVTAIDAESGGKQRQLGSGWVCDTMDTLLL